MIICKLSYQCTIHIITQSGYASKESEYIFAYMYTCINCAYGYDNEVDKCICYYFTYK